jgi:hypothetical protein
VVRSARKNPNVVLFARGNSLELMGGRTLGYCNIRSVWSSASEIRDAIYHFDGKEYKLWKEKKTRIRP